MSKKSPFGAVITDKYRIIGVIGKGTYGIVHKAEKYGGRRKPQIIALKMVKSQREDQNEVITTLSTLREIKLLRELSHENIVKLEEVVIDPEQSKLFLAFDYAEHDLRQLVKAHKEQFKNLHPLVVKSIMYQILEGIFYLHENWVIHRDITPQNILLHGRGDTDPGKIKIADFGLARIFRSPLKPFVEVEKVVVTLWYRAPELLLGALHYNCAVDIWAVGCIFAELLTLKELFQGQENRDNGAPFQHDQCDKIFSMMGLPNEVNFPQSTKLPHYPEVLNMANRKNYVNQFDMHFARLEHSHPGAVDLLRSMLEYDPEKRISAGAALAHHYFTQPPIFNPITDKNIFSLRDVELFEFPKRIPEQNRDSSSSLGNQYQSAARQANMNATSHRHPFQSHSEKPLEYHPYVERKHEIRGVKRQRSISSQESRKKMAKEKNN